MAINGPLRILCLFLLYKPFLSGICNGCILLEGGGEFQGVMAALALLPWNWQAVIIADERLSPRPLQLITINPVQGGMAFIGFAV